MDDIALFHTIIGGKNVWLLGESYLYENLLNYEKVFDFLNDAFLDYTPDIYFELSSDLSSSLCKLLIELFPDNNYIAFDTREDFVNSMLLFYPINKTMSISKILNLFVEPFYKNLDKFNFIPRNRFEDYLMNIEFPKIFNIFEKIKQTLIFKKKIDYNDLTQELFHAWIIIIDYFFLKDLFHINNDIIILINKNNFDYIVGEILLPYDNLSKIWKRNEYEEIKT